MKRNYLNETKTGLKTLLAGLLLFGSLLTRAQCTANFTYTLGASGSVSFTSISSGTNMNTSYTWNFAGPSFVAGTSPIWVFNTNGPKVVCLTITDSISSCTDTKCDTIMINSISTPTSTPCAANFSFALGSNGSVSFVSTSTGTTAGTNYSWNFGGSSGSGASTTHTYNSNGWKMVCLTIINNAPNSCTSTACDSIHITNVSTSTTTPCNASFTYTLGANGSVNFASTSTGVSGSTNYSWSFGNSATGSGATPSHTYSSNGLKWVCLTITNSTCNSTYCDSLLISNTSGSNTPCNPSVVYTLQKDSSMALTWNAYPYYPSNVTNALWSWGDGSSSPGLYPSHTYSAAGTYSTCVTISVSCGTVTATYCYVAAIFRSSDNNDMIQVNVIPAGETGIKKQVISEGQLNIYPNPSSGEFIVELNTHGSSSKESTICIYNMIGEKVFEKQVLTNGKQTVDVSNLASGTYLVKMNSDTGSLHKKITIQR